MQLIARRATEVIGAGRIAPGDDALRVLYGHVFHRLDEEYLRLRHRRLGCAVHGHDELVGVLAHAEAAHGALGPLRRFGQRDLDLRIAEETVDAAQVRHGGEATLLQRGLQRGGGVLPGDRFKLGSRSDGPAYEACREKRARQATPASCAC